MKRRTFSKEEKIKILEEARQNGVNETLSKHGIYPATYYSWRNKMAEMGEAGFRHGMTKAKLKEIKRLEKENLKLKEIIADKELEIKMQQEILKKNRPLWEKKGL